MRHININELKNEADKLNWKEAEKKHNAELKNKNPSERSKYFNDNRDWNRFQDAMLKLSGMKCWYSEARIGSSDFEVDHFRPKNRSKQDDGSILKENGYWWLAYNWKNYRLAGGLVNKRRRDRLNLDDQVKGKGDYFPLDLKEGKIAKDCQSVRCELPLLLDPTSNYDVSLISFEKNGEVISVGMTENEELRAKLSIKLYHLDLEQLDYERSQVWNECEDKLKEANECIKESDNETERRKTLELCYKDLSKKIKKCAAYSSVARACIFMHVELDEYKLWLKNFSRTI